MFHKITPELQDRSVQDQDQDYSLQDQDRFFWSQTGLILRLTVSDHITDQNVSTLDFTGAKDDGDGGNNCSY